MLFKNLPKYTNNTCKIGQGNECCRYLLMGEDGFECGKLTDLKGELDQRVADDSIVAQGNNCEGIEVKFSIKVLNKKQ